MDFSRNYQVEDFEQLYSKFKHHDISILVNNVSFFDGNLFTELSENSVHSMMVVNCYAVTLLTKLVLSNFKKRYQQNKKPSLIVNHCAGASIAPMPYLQTYSGTKIFCDFLSEGLNYELKEFGVDVLGIRTFGLK